MKIYGRKISLFQIATVALVTAITAGYNGCGKVSYVPPTEATTDLSSLTTLTAPGAFTVTTLSSNSLKLTWQLATPAAATYTVERSMDGIVFALHASLPAGSVEFIDSGLGPSTVYYYRIAAHQGSLLPAYSVIGSGTTSPLPLTVPAAPSGLTANPTSSTAIALQWVDNASNETAYVVQRSSNGTTYVTVANIAASSTSYTDNSLAPSSTYYFRIFATNTVGNSGFSNVVMAATQPPPVTVPAAPTALLATAVSSTAINLRWVDNANNETSYVVRRSLDNVTYTTLATLAANATTFADTGLAASTTYHYRVYANNGAGPSGISNTATTVTEPPPVLPPAAPTNLTGSVLSSSSIRLQWTDNATNETSYAVQRSVDGTAFTLVSTLSADSTQFTDTGLMASTSYFYRVRAINSAGGTLSNIFSATTHAAVVIPAAPTGLAASPLSSTSISLTWTDNATNETGYTVQRSLDNVTFGLVTTLASGSVSFTDAGLTASTLYYYRVFATNSAGRSAFSNVSSATTLAAANPCSGIAIGARCVGTTALYAGMFAGSPYMVTPGNCTNSATPTCNGALDTLALEWSSVDSVTGVTGTANGRANTNTLVGLGTTFLAAQYCYNLNYGGYADWFLPAEDELSGILYARKVAIGGFQDAPSTGHRYHSSTEFDATNSRRMNFDTGAMLTGPKTIPGSIANNNAKLVRCVRRY